MSDPFQFSTDEMATRLVRIRETMAAQSLDAIITSNQPNVRYTTGFRGEPHTLLITQQELILYTSFRTLPWAENQTQQLGTNIELSTIAPALDDIATRLKGQTLQIGIDRTCSHSQFLTLHKQFASHTIQPCTVIETVRRCKSAAEVQIMQHSQRINEEIFNAVLPKIQLAMTERTVQGLILSEIAQRDEVDGYSFPPIAAVGGNAWEIHHLPDLTQIQKNDMLLLDLGVIYQGYASDMTRTICLGTPTAQMKEVYHTVGNAQSTAIAAIKPGAETHAIDQAARNVITEAGHGKSFTHGLGHSIGLETHDPGLNLSPYTPNEILKPGMAFTVEPGIYLPEAFGVRTEDVVIVTEDGNQNITQQTHDLLEIHI